MELFGPDLGLSLVSGIWTRLRAYMIWPYSETERAACIVKPYISALSSIETKYCNDPDAVEAHSRVYSAFREIDGWRSLSACRPDDEQGKDSRSLRTAAAILDIVRKTPNGLGSAHK